MQLALSKPVNSNMISCMRCWSHGKAGFDDKVRCAQIIIVDKEKCQVLATSNMSPNFNIYNKLKNKKNISNVEHITDNNIMLVAMRQMYCHFTLKVRSLDRDPYLDFDNLCVVSELDQINMIPAKSWQKTVSTFLFLKGKKTNNSAIWELLLTSHNFYLNSGFVWEAYWLVACIKKTLARSQIQGWVGSRFPILISKW